MLDFSHNFSNPNILAAHEQHTRRHVPQLGVRAPEAV
jgi:hypothetical protein